MSSAIPGIHHVTAITADAQKNIDFYSGVLGLRMVKLTVNYDDPGSYHLYYGDHMGRPGTIMTFFAWPGADRGRIGPPQVMTTVFAAPAGATRYWVDRLEAHGVALQPIATRFGEEVIGFDDPDGLKLEIVMTAESASAAPSTGPTPAEHAIRGFRGVTLAEEGYEHTARLLTEAMGFRAAGSEANRFRYRAAGDGPASTVDLVCVPGVRRGRMGAGVVHHVAFRTGDDPRQAALREQLVERGHNVSPVMDRNYFHSIYFREPGGVLFEIATDPPGFTVDERLEELGTRLRLPPWMEPHREQIEQVLPPVRFPAWPGL